MQGVGAAAGHRTGKADHKGNRRKAPLRDRAQKEAARTCRNGYDFLKERIKPICSPSVFRQGYDGKVYELITRENYIFLRDSYFRYADLTGVRPAPHDPGKSHSEGIVNLYREMRVLLGKGQHLNFDYDLGRLYFTIWSDHKWGDYELYWFPVKFLSGLNPKLRRIAVTFLHEFMKSNGLDTLLDTPDLEMATSWIDDTLHEYSPEDRVFYKKDLESHESGKAYRALRRIEKRSYYKDLPRAVRRYEPLNDYEQKLVSLMKEGLQFIGSEKPSIMHFGYDPYYEEEPDFRPMDLDRQIRLVYDLDDLITESVQDTFNCEQRETYAIVPITTLRLSPDTETVFAMDDYPERFFRWADKFVNHIA